MKKDNYKFKITWQIFLPFFIGIMIFIVLTSVVSISTIKYIFNLNLAKENQQIINIVENNIDKIKKDTLQYLNLIKQNRKFNNSFYYSIEYLLDDSIPIKKFVSYYKEKLNLSFIATFNKNKKVISSTITDNKNIISYLNKSKLKNDNIVDITFVNSTPSIIGLTKLYLFDDFMGYLIIGFDVNDIFLNKLKYITNRNLILIDMDNKLICSTIKDNTFNNYLLKNKFKTNTINYNEIEYYLKIVEINNNEKQKIAKLCIISDLSLLKKSNNNILIRFLTIFICISLLIFITCYFIAKKLKGKINSLFIKLEDYQTKLLKQSTFAAIGQSTSMVAHDVRRPLAGMKALLNNLPKIKDDPEKVRQMLASVDISITRTNAMLNEILDFSKDKLSLNLSNCNPQSIITSAISESLRSLSDINIKIKYNLKHKNYLNVDTNRIIRVLTNIISNAVEAMNGNGKLWIKTLDNEKNSTMSITIGDDGPAIPDDIKDKIFDPFFTKGKQSGTGLGLAICKKIIESHNGTIFVTANPQMPSTEFIITLPSTIGKLEIKSEELIYSSDELTQFRKEEVNRIEYGDTINTTEVMNIHKNIKRPLNLLVVDDESLFRDTIKTLLDATTPVRDYINFFESENAEHAQEILKNNKIDYLISDIDLGNDKINGYELTKDVLKNYPNTYVVINSNKRRDEMDETLRENATPCFLGFLPKPMQKSELLHFLARKTFETEINQKAAPIQDKKTDTNKDTVLILNDDVIILMSLELMAKNYANTVTAENYEQAVEKYESNKIDLIISDINLRKDELNGYEFLKWVKKQNKDIPIYMLSGYSEVMERPIAIENGATGYYQLPIEEKQIEEIILTKPKQTKDNLEKEEISQKPNDDIGDYNIDEKQEQKIKKAVHDINNPLATLSLIIKAQENIEQQDKEYLIEALHEIGDAARSLKGNSTDEKIRKVVHDINNPLATLSLIIRSQENINDQDKDMLIEALHEIGNAVRSL